MTESVAHSLVFSRCWHESSLWKSRPYPTDVSIMRIWHVQSCSVNSFHPASFIYTYDLISPFVSFPHFPTCTCSWTWVCLALDRDLEEIPKISPHAAHLMGVIVLSPLIWALVRWKRLSPSSDWEELNNYGWEGSTKSVKPDTATTGLCRA